MNQKAQSPGPRIPSALLLVVAVMIVSLLLVPQSPLSVIGGGGCPDEPITDAVGNELTSFNQLRSLMQTDMSDEELQDLGVYMREGVLYAPVDVCGGEIN